jgi:hypothetical protein
MPIGCSDTVVYQCEIHGQCTIPDCQTCVYYWNEKKFGPKTDEVVTRAGGT